MKQLRIHRLRKQDDEPEELARIQQALSSYEAYVRAQFRQFLDSVRVPEVLAQVASAIADRRWADAYAIVDSYIVRLGDNIVSMIPFIGRQEAQALAAQRGMAGAGVGISFNPTSPQVVEAMQRNRMQLIAQMTQDQRLAINQALTQSIREGEAAQAAARRFRDVLGLTSYQQNMVETYRTLLENNNRQALDRTLRDRRYDRGFENAIEEGEVLPPDRIDLMVDRYRTRLLNMRGEVIARTEAGRVLEETRYLSTQQAVDSTGVPRSQTVKQWFATKDNRTRDTHAAMNGQARLLEDYFDSPSGARLMYPHDSDAPASEVIACRCQPVYHIFSTYEEAQAFLRENGQGRYG